MILIIALLVCVPSGYCYETTYPRIFEPSVINEIIDMKNFVDKTDLLKLFFESDYMQMVAAPHNFGKSAMMDLIKKFCEISVDEKGVKIAREKTHNFKFFKRFKLKVFDDKLFLYNQFGMYPVVYLDFSKLFTTNYISFLKSFKETIRRAHRDHLYLLYNDTLGLDPNHRFRLNYDRMILKTLQPEAMQFGIMNLEYLLYLYYKDRKCVLLIDGYDELMRNIIFNSGPEADKILNFTVEFVSFNILASPFVVRAYLNSCLRVRPDIPDDPFNITHIPFLGNHKFTPYYGFTEEEVRTLLANENMTEMFDEVKKWYGGYKVRNSSVSLYNPISVVSYLRYKKFEGYWTESGPIKITERILWQKDVKEKIDQVLEHGSTTINYLGYLNQSDVLQLKEIVAMDEDFQYTTEDVDLFMQFLTDQGYFIIVSTEPSAVVRIEIPNQEIREFFIEGRKIRERKGTD